MSAFTTSGGVHVVGSERGGRVSVTTPAFSGGVLQKGFFGTTTANGPSAAYDPSSGTVAIASLDDGRRVHVQRFVFDP